MQHDQINEQSKPPQPTTTKSGREKLWTDNFMAISLTNFLITTGSHMLSTAFPFYLVSLGGDDTTVGIAAALYSICALIMRPISGWLLDHKSRRVIFMVGLLALAIIPPGYLIWPALAMSVILRGIQGFAFSATGTAANANVCDILPPSRFGEGIGYFGLTNSLAMVIGPALGLAIWYAAGATPLILSYSGFAVISLLALMRFKFKQLPPRPADEVSFTFWQRLTSTFEKSALPAAALLVCVSMSGGATVAFAALYAASTGVANGGFFFTFQAIGTIVIRLIVKDLSDKYGEGPSLYIGVSSFIAGYFCMVFATQSWVFYLGGLLVGVGCGVIYPALQKMSLGIVPPNRRGAASSTYLCFLDISFGGGGLLAGLLADALGYKLMFIIMSAFLLSCLPVYWLWASKTPAAHKMIQKAKAEKAKLE